MELYIYAAACCGVVFTLLHAVEWNGVVLLHVDGTDRNGTEQFRHIILRNGTGSNAYTTAKYIKLHAECSTCFSGK